MIRIKSDSFSHGYCICTWLLKHGHRFDLGSHPIHFTVCKEDYEQMRGRGLITILNRFETFYPFYT